VTQVVPSVRIWLLVAALAMAAVFLLSYRSVRQSQISTAAVDHTQQTLTSLVALEGTIADLIFASGDEAITRTSEMAMKRIEDLSVLTSTTTGNNSASAVCAARLKRWPGRVVAARRRERYSLGGLRASKPVANGARTPR
jgi:hypothetical protein